MSVTVRDIKNMIEHGNLTQIKELYDALRSDEDPALDWVTLFKDCYLHACLKKKPRIAAWFEEVFKEFDPIAQIALRQTFSYGRYLLRK